MKNFLTLTALALLSGSAFAGTASAKDYCHPSIGNWVNAAKVSCPSTGSGEANQHPLTARIVHECEHTKRG